jgi:hypothetical protein
MNQERSRVFSAADKTELWDRWQRGESLKAIGRAFDKPSSSIYFQVAPYGGLSDASTSLEVAVDRLGTRGESRGIAAHESGRSIAKLLLRPA